MTCSSKRKKFTEDGLSVCLLPYDGKMDVPNAPSPSAQCSMDITVILRRLQPWQLTLHHCIRRQDSEAVECRDTSKWADTVHVLRPSDQRCSGDEMSTTLSSMLMKCLQPSRLCWWNVYNPLIYSDEMSTTLSSMLMKCLQSSHLCWWNV